jgi:hypothetical protein
MSFFSIAASYLYLVPLIPILIVAVLSVGYWCILAAQASRLALGRLLLRQSRCILESATIRRWASAGTTSRRNRTELRSASQ